MCGATLLRCTFFLKCRMLAAMQKEHAQQQTLARSVVFQGIGIHTGEPVTMRFVPAPVNTGIRFCRVDLPNAPEVPATVAGVCDTSRSTTLGIGGVALVHTVEHVLAALKAYQIDNLVIELSAHEPPVGRGGALEFVSMIEEVGIVAQSQRRKVFRITHPIFLSSGPVHLVALPDASYRISYTLSYPESPFLDGQYYSFEVSAEGFKREIAPCRTFCLKEELLFLMQKKLIRGGALSNAVVVDGNVAWSEGGLHFSNEMARHKILDLIGDLSLIGTDLVAHVIAIRSGHATNVAFAKQIASLIGESDE